MDKLNSYIRKHVFGYPHNSEALNNAVKATPLANLNRVFLFGAGLLYAARVAQASTSAPAATTGTVISADEYDEDITFTFTRTTTGSYKLAVAGLPSTTDATKVHVRFTSWANPLKVTGIAFTDGVLNITFETIAGTDVFTSDIEVYYVN